MKEEDIFFLPFFIKEKVYVIDKEQFETSLGTENTLLPSEEITHAPPPDYLILHQEPSPLPTAQEELLQNILKAIHISQNQVEKKAFSACAFTRKEICLCIITRTPTKTT
jgi:hypothetical protein